MKLELRDQEMIGEPADMACEPLRLNLPQDFLPEPVLLSRMLVPSKELITARLLNGSLSDPVADEAPRGGRGEPVRRFD